MKKILCLFLLPAMLAFQACGGSDDDEVVQPVSGDTVQVVPPQPSLPLPIVKNYSEEEFSSLFVGGLWHQLRIYDVYEDGHLDDLYLSHLIGYAPCFLKPIDTDSMRYHLHVEDPGRPDIDKMVTYRYSDSNQLQIWGIGEVQFNEAMTVLEIKADTLRLLGPVYSTQWAPEAVAGLYIYNRLSDEKATIIEQRWERGEKI